MDYGIKISFAHIRLYVIAGSDVGTTKRGSPSSAQRKPIVIAKPVQLHQGEPNTGVAPRGWRATRTTPLAQELPANGGVADDEGYVP